MPVTIRMLEHEITELKTEVQKRDHLITDLQGKLDAVEDTVTALEGTVDDLQFDLDIAHDEIRDLEGDAQDTEVRAEKIREIFSECRACLWALKREHSGCWCDGGEAHSLECTEIQNLFKWNPPQQIFPDGAFFASLRDGHD